MAGDKQPLQEKPPKKQTTQGKRRCGSYTCLKVSVVIYGLLFLIIGLCVFVIGAWALSVKHKYESLKDILTSPSILAIVVGITVIIFAIIGIIGAVREHVLLLKIFLAVIIIVFILQVVIGILAFVFRSEVYRLSKENLKYILEEYHTNLDIENVVNYIQRKYDCCGLGIDSYKDWKINVKFLCHGPDEIACSVPNSCCINEVQDCGKNISEVAVGQRLHTRGCLMAFKSWFESHLDIVGAVVLALAIPQILAMYLVYIYIVKVEDRRYLYKYRKRYEMEQS